MCDLLSEYHERVLLECITNKSIFYSKWLDPNRIHKVEHTKDGFIINHIIYDQFKKVRFNYVRLT